MSDSSNDPISFVEAEAYFELQDNRFLTALRRYQNWKRLTTFTAEWKKDPRPWAQEQIRRYLEMPLSCRGHQPVVKQLFKQALDTKQHETLAICLVAFDRLVRYEQKTRLRYNWQMRETYTEERLVTPRNVAPLELKRNKRDVWTGRMIQVAVPPNSREILFSYKTRYYLRRRAWRYFRFLGFRDPSAYVPAVSQALVRYEDADLQHGHDILASWGLMHICYGGGSQLRKSSSHIWLAPDATFDSLRPAPYFPKLWNSDQGFRELWNLMLHAKSRLVRMWSISLMESDHQDRLAKVGVEDLVRCLGHEEELISEFGSRWFGSCKDLATLSVERWLRLLESPHPAAVDAVCSAMAQHVDVSRLAFEDCVRLATAAPVSVARIGLDWLKQRPPRTHEEQEQLVRLSRAKCVALGGEIAQWALAQVGTKENYRREIASELLDSLNQGCRQGAWNWLISPESAGKDDPVLWSRLVESPHEDIQLPLLNVLRQKSHTQKPANGEVVANTGLSPAELTPVWSRVLSNIHRGGRQKLTALSQIKSAILKRTDLFESLLPILKVAIRSVRGPERSAGLAAVMEILAKAPELEDRLLREFPELKLDLQSVFAVRNA